VKVPEELRYTKDHEWARKRDGDAVTVGITDYAQDALGDITYLELPSAGAEVQAGGSCGVIESVKTFSDIYAPVSGEVVEVNDALDGNEAVVNESPYDGGWLFVINMSDPAQWDSLLDAEAYRAHLAEESE
jgi:glycine cleavage system H protein